MESSAIKCNLPELKIAQMLKWFFPNLDHFHGHQTVKYFIFFACLCNIIYENYIFSIVMSMFFNFPSNTRFLYEENRKKLEQHNEKSKENWVTLKIDRKC